MNIIAPPNNHPFCQEAKELAQKLAETLQSNGYDAEIQIDPYTNCSQGEVHFNCSVRMKTKIERQTK